MFNGAHVIMYSNSVEADRAFIRDTLGFAGIDSGDGWVIFKLPPAEIAVHPVEGDTRHELYLMCDNIENVLAELAAKGVDVSHSVSDEGWGLLASIRLPSGSDLSLYQPRHTVAYDLDR